MDKQSLLTGISKLAMAGEQAGFSIEQMIQLRNDGLSVESLLDLIMWRHEIPNPATPPASTYWVI